MFAVADPERSVAGEVTVEAQMKRPTLNTALALGFLLSGGCIDVKEMGDTEAMDDSSGSESSAGVTASSSGSDSQSSSGTSTSGDPTMSTSASGPTTATSTSATSGTVTSGNVSMTASASETVTVSTGDSTGGESSTGVDTDGDAEQMGCEASGGTWDESACRHYQCGLPNGSAAVIPGCDCGPAANFGPSEEFPGGSGCVADDTCENDAVFDCGPELSCTTFAEYCEVFVPGVKGSPTTYTCCDAPNECVGGLDCDCLEGTDVFCQDCDEAEDGGVTTQVFAP